MDDKKAADILLGLMKKYKLEGEEKEAMENAIDILGWTSLAQSRIKKIKERKEKSFE